MEIKKVGVALLGLGVVGGGTYKILTEKREAICKSDGVDIEIKRVLDKNSERIKELGIDESLVARSIDEIAADKEVHIVAEFFGGVEPARSFLIRALEAGKSVVTANKEMLSKCWHELELAARRGGGGVYFEASCVGGVPVIRTLTDSMQGNAITSMKGIVNGTTNYILSRMSDEGASYDACLKEAQRLGYAEADPSADVDGFDSTYKNSILSSLAYRTRVPVDTVYREGISDIDVKDIAIGKDLGYTIKLLAVSKCAGGAIEARVHPAFLPHSHPLSSVKGSFNALFLHGDNVGDVMLYGRGAGALPTGSAIVSDIAFAAGKERHRRFDFETEEVDRAKFVGDFSCGYYLRVIADSASLGKIIDVLRRNGVSDCAVKTVGENETVFVTHKIKESAAKRAVRDMELLSGVEKVAALIRIED